MALNIRIVATSNRDMAEAVSRGVFREDLYYRLNVFPLPIPALRQRPDDIVPLARHFLAAHGGMLGRSGVTLSPAAEIALRSHTWPGNVRELENVLQRAMIMAPADSVDASHLHLQASPASTARSVSAPAAVLEVSGDKTEAQRSENIRDLEREHILETLTAVGGSRKLAIERLGISERTLRYKLKQYKDEGFFQE